MNRIGGKSNSQVKVEKTPEIILLTKDNHSSAIKQVASGRFGVTVIIYSMRKKFN